MEKVEERIKKELEAKKTNKKTYIWIFSLLLLSTFIGIYSYETNSGVLSKHTLNKEVKVKNQENLELLFTKNQLKFQNQQQEDKSVMALNDMVIQEAPKEKSFENAQQEDTNQMVINDETLSVKEKNVLHNPFKEEQEQQKQNGIAYAKEEVLSEDKELQAKKPIKPKKSEPMVQKTDLHALSFQIVTCLNYDMQTSVPNEDCKSKITSHLNATSSISSIEIISIINAQQTSQTNLSTQTLVQKRTNAMSDFIQSLKPSVEIKSETSYLKVSLQHNGVVVRVYN